MQQKECRMATSQHPILKTEAAKFEAFNLSVEIEVAVHFASFFFSVLTFPPGAAATGAELFWDSLIWIKSNKDGLFFSRKPKGLGSSSGLYCEGVAGKSFFPVHF